MKHKLLLLNFGLALAAAAGGWRLRQEWLRDRAHAEEVIERRVAPAAAPAVVKVPAPAPFVSPAYADVAQKDLFAKDRNPNVIVEPVVVKPEEPMPPLPILTGVMGLPGGMVALLAEKKNERSRGVKIGESVGPFKLVALNTEKLSFEWKGKTVEKKAEELMDRGGDAQPAASAPPVAANLGQNPLNLAQQKGGPPPPPKPGVDVGAQMKSCQAGDVSPAGTVVDGYKKIVENTPFGPACRWIPAN